MRDKRFYQGVGWGADMNGFGAQGGPRNGPNPVTYPFKSWDGKVTIGQQHSGQRVYDINKDGVAHYGLYPDWVEDLRHIAGQAIVDDLGRGAEAYLQMWERADGIPTGCRPAKAQADAARAGGRAARRLARRRCCGARASRSVRGAKALALLRQGRPDGRGADPERAGRAGRLDRARPQGARGPAGGEDEEGPHGATRGAASSTSSGTGA